MRRQRTRACEHLRRRCSPPGIPRPVRLGRRTERRGERRLRLAQRDPACTQRTGFHDVTPCHRRRPLGSAGVGLAVLQSANLWGRPVTFFACTFAPGAEAEGTIGEFFRKMARPAGFEPATLGLEGPTSLHDRTPQGIVRLTLRPAQCRDEHSPAPLPSASLSARHHQPCRLALPRILHELPGC